MAAQHLSLAEGLGTDVVLSWRMYGGAVLSALAFLLEDEASAIGRGFKALIIHHLFFLQEHQHIDRHISTFCVQNHPPPPFLSSIFQGLGSHCLPFSTLFQGKMRLILTFFQDLTFLSS